MKATLILSLFFVSFAYADIGDACRWNGERGTCQKVSKCSAGFTVTGACPSDPDDVKCCIKKGCQNPSTDLQGSCLDKDRLSCAGSFITGQCPGPNNVQCCIKDPKPSVPSVPSTPSCPAVKHDTGTLGSQNFIFSRKATDTFAGVVGGIGKGAEACAAISAISEVGAPVAVLCGLGGVALDFISDHAHECHDKNQCLKLTLPPLTALPLPFCVGAGDGCCG